MPMEAKWCFAENDSKHVRQVVILVPSEAQVPPRVDDLVLPPERACYVYA